MIVSPRLLLFMHTEFSQTGFTAFLLLHHNLLFCDLLRFCIFLSQQDLTRLIVKADTATVCIPELDFEIPPSTDKGSVTTIEGILMTAAEELEKGQPVRKVVSTSCCLCTLE